MFGYVFMPASKYSGWNSPFQLKSSSNRLYHFFIRFECLLLKIQIQVCNFEASATVSSVFFKLVSYFFFGSMRLFILPSGKGVICDVWTAHFFLCIHGILILVKNKISSYLGSNRSTLAILVIFEFFTYHPENMWIKFDQCSSRMAFSIWLLLHQCTCIKLYKHTINMPSCKSCGELRASVSL